MLRTVFLLMMSLMLAATSAAMPSDLDVAAQQIRDEAAANRLVLIGEKHGTRETPDLFARLATAYAAEAPLLVGLEIPRGNQAALDAYLRSDGSGRALEALLATTFWTVSDNQHDGRRSHDMLDLIGHVRALRAEGRDIALLAYDLDSSEKPDPEREQKMAARIAAAYAALPRGRLLVLSGNVHAMQQRPAYAPPQMPVPMGYWLRELAPYSVDIVAARGAFWACQSRCGPLAVQGHAGTSGPLSDDVYDLRVVLPRFTVGHLLGADIPPTLVESSGTVPQT